MDVCDDEKVAASGHRHRERAARSSPITPCSSSRCSARSRKRRRAARAYETREGSQARRRTSSTSTRNLAQRTARELARPSSSKEEAQRMFKLGLLDARRQGEDRDGLLADLPAASSSIAPRPELRAGGSGGARDAALGDQYICNFSVFQSLLDHWALGQLFPIMPIHRLNEAPAHAAHARRHHLRLRRQGLQVHRPARTCKDTLPLHRARTASPTTSASS